MTLDIQAIKEQLNILQGNWESDEQAYDASEAMGEVLEVGQILLAAIEQLRNTLTRIRDVKSRDHVDANRRLVHIDNMACQALGGDFMTDVHVDEENQRLREALEYIQRHRMLVGEMAYIVARNALGNENKSYAEIYVGQDDPTVAFIREHRARQALEGATT